MLDNRPFIDEKGTWLDVLLDYANKDNREEDDDE